MQLIAFTNPLKLSGNFIRFLLVVQIQQLHMLCILMRMIEMKRKYFVCIWLKRMQRRIYEYKYVKVKISKYPAKNIKNLNRVRQTYFPNSKPITSKLDGQTNIPSFRFEYVSIDNRQFPRNKFVSFFRFLSMPNASNSPLNSTRFEWEWTIVRNKNQIKMWTRVAIISTEY